MMNLFLDTIKNVIKDLKLLKHHPSKSVKNNALDRLLSMQIDTSDTYLTDNILDTISTDISNNHYNKALDNLEELYNNINVSLLKRG